MNFSALGSVLVLEPSSGAMVPLDLDLLREELRESFRQCGFQEEWMGDSLLGVLREKVRENREDGLEMTRQDVEESLLGALDATGFSDVAEAYRGRHPRLPGEFSRCLREWTAESLAAFLGRCPDVPSGMLPEILRQLPERLAGAGYPRVSEALILEYARHLVHGLRAQSGEPFPELTLCSRVRYIAADQWNLPLTDACLALQERRVIWLQPVSDILPVVVVQCRLARLLDFSEPPLDEASFQTRVSRLSPLLLECLVLMQGQVQRQWPEVAGAVRGVVRFVDFSALPPLLCASRRRKERRELSLRLEEALRTPFSASPLPVLVRFR